MDCGASQTITCSLVNCKDEIEKVAIIETAGGEEHMKSTLECTKTYFVRNRMGEVVTITVPALFVRGSQQDLPGGKSVNFANILAILDSEDYIHHRWDKKQEQHYQYSIEFIGEQTYLFYLFYLQTEILSGQLMII